MFDFVYVEAPASASVQQEYVIESAADLAWNTPLKSIALWHEETMTKTQLDKDWKLNDFFGSIYVINLPTAKKRLQKITEELNDIGIKDFNVFPGVNGRKELKASIWKKFHGNRDGINPNTKKGKQQLDKLHQGEAGCYMSHYRLLKSIKENFDLAKKNYVQAFASMDLQKIEEAKKKIRRYSRVLIFEDDAAFGIINEKRTKAKKKYAGCLLRKAIKELPNHWDMLYLVVRATEPSQKSSTHLRKMNRSYCALAYAVNYSMYDHLIEHLKKIENPLVTHVEPVDNAISSLHSKHHVYAINPSIVYHQLGPSQISDKSRERFWQGQPVCTPNQR